MKVIIDVSEHNGTLDWEAIKPQIDGAILRCGYGGDTPSQDDLQYIRNANECTRLQIPFGVYLFSYARNGQEAIDEAQHTLRLVKDYNLDLPIYYDLEYSAYIGDLNASQYTEIANAYCEKIEAAGGYVGIYANTYFWQSKLMNVNAYTRWVAQWASSVTLDKKYKLWQYSSDGQINGSSARTDVNRWYDDFLTMCGTKNYFKGGDTPTPPTPSPSLRYGVGDQVSFNALYTNSMATDKITNIAVHSGTITKVIKDALNPYLINNGTGWVNDEVIVNGNPVTPTPNPSVSYHVGDEVSFDALYSSSTSSQKITNIAVTKGVITRIIPGAPNPYLINNGTGWVNDDVIVNANKPTPTPSLQVGNQVRVKQGASDYNGNSLASFVYNTTYVVMEIRGDRVVIGNGTQVTAAMHMEDLYRV